jgi:hypothetical protein
MDLLRQKCGIYTGNIDPKQLYGENTRIDGFREMALFRIRLLLQGNNGCLQNSEIDQEFARYKEICCGCRDTHLTTMIEAKCYIIPPKTSQIACTVEKVTAELDKIAQLIKSTESAINALIRRLKLQKRLKN